MGLVQYIARLRTEISNKIKYVKLDISCQGWKLALLLGKQRQPLIILY